MITGIYTVLQSTSKNTVVLSVVKFCHNYPQVYILNLQRYISKFY